MRAIYTRLSRDRYRGMSTSTADQERECREFAAARGWRAVEVFTDHDVSATSTKRKRPAWERMLARLDEVEAIVCWDSTRLYRRPRDLELLIDYAERGRLSVHALHSGDLDLATPDGRAVARTLAAWNKAEVERVGDRVRRKKASLARDGKPGGSRRPFGYEADEKGRLTGRLVEEEAEAYREAAGVVLNGASLLSVVRTWDGCGLAGSSGGAWTPNSVRRVLTNPRYAARRVHQGKDVGRAEWPAIVTKRDHERLVRLLRDPARRKGQPGPQYLLTGMLECGICSGRMGGRPQNGERGYVCKRTGKVHLAVRALPLEELVTRRASDLWVPEPAAIADPAALSAELLREREEAEARLEALGAEYARGEVSAQAFRGIDRQLSTQLAEVDRRLEESAPRRATREYLQHIEEPDDAEAFYADLSTRAWLETLLEKVVVGPASRVGPAAERLEKRVDLVLRDGVRDRRAAAGVPKPRGRKRSRRA